MSRTRILITEVTITKAGQRKNFQIKLPKNAINVIGIANDLRMNGLSERIAYPIKALSEEYAIKDTELIKTPTLAEGDNLNQVAQQLNNRQSSLVGKLLLQSLEKANIFYADQIWSVPFDDGVGDITDDLYAWDAFELPQKAGYKTVSVPAGTTIINGMFKDLTGDTVKSGMLKDLTADTIKRNIAYTIKVLLWIETDEKEITLDKK